MDFAPHERAERLVDELVAGDGPQARELRRNDLRGEMRVVVGLHAHLGARQSGTDEFGNSFGGHGIRVHRAILSVMIAA